MSLNPPNVKDINAQIIATVEFQISQVIPLFPKAFVRVLAKALAGVIVLLYKYAGFIFLQMFVTTASGKPTTINGVTRTPLHEWGTLVGVGLPVAVSADYGVTYLSVGPVYLDAAEITIPVVAAAVQSGNTGAGVIGNLDDGAIVSFANPHPGILQDTIVASTTATGADAEAEENYRQRVIDRFQKRPQGGALADYEAWA